VVMWKAGNQETELATDSCFPAFHIFGILKT
jgi:hypothetical protein